jgi:hypothetical protein
MEYLDAESRAREHIRSPASQNWQADYEAWCKSPLYNVKVVHILVDGIYVNAGLEKYKAALSPGRPFSCDLNDRA